MKIHFTNDPKKRVETGDVMEVSPQAFNAVKSWLGVEVSGLSYYVDKACSLGANKVVKAKSKK